MHTNLPTPGTRIVYITKPVIHQLPGRKDKRDPAGTQWTGTILRVYDDWAGKWKGRIDILQDVTGIVKTIATWSWKEMTNPTEFTCRGGPIHDEHQYTIGVLSTPEDE
jgi:hypothetical protein